VNNTYAKRKANIIGILKDPDLNLTRKERLRHVYHWVRYELANLQEDSAKRQINKYGKKLNEDVEVFNLRIKMKNF